MSKPFSSILLLIFGGMVLWKVSTSVFDLWGYARLGSEVPAQITTWEIVPKGAQFALKGSYSYIFNGKNFNGITQFSKPYYLNKMSAEKQIQKMSGMTWTAWIDPDTPRFSSLEKNFPLRKTFYAACLLGIFLYFVYLKFYLELFSKSM